MVCLWFCDSLGSQQRGCAGTEWCWGQRPQYLDAVHLSECKYSISHKYTDFLCWGTHSHADTNQNEGQLPGHLPSSFLTLARKQTRMQIYGDSLKSASVYTENQSFKPWTVWVSRCWPSADRIIPLSLSTAGKHSSNELLWGCQGCWWLVLFSSALELPSSWMLTLRGSFVSRDLVHTLGITSWKDFNGFLTPIVACENSVLQTRYCIYLRVHTFLWLWEATQRRVFLFIFHPLLSMFSFLCFKSSDQSQLVIEHNAPCMIRKLHCGSCLF